MSKLLSIRGYQGNSMDLPTANVTTSAAYYRDKMKFNIVEVTEVSAVLERDGIQMAIAANGRLPIQASPDRVVETTEEVTKLTQIKTMVSNLIKNKS